ncbi:Dihydroxyacetone phosphate acyltransferase [Dirofilaria immitis]
MEWISLRVYARTVSIVFDTFTYNLSGGNSEFLDGLSEIFRVVCSLWSSQILNSNYFPVLDLKAVRKFVKMFKVVMTMEEFSTYVREEIYSLRFVVLLLTLIILLFIIVQICENLYSFIRLAQQNLEINEYSPTGIIMKSPNKFKRKHSRKTSRRREKMNKKAITQFSSFSDKSNGKNHRKKIFDEKSMKILKSSLFSASFIPFNPLNCPRKSLEENFFTQKYITTKQQSANKFSITTNERAEEEKSKKLSAVIIDSPNTENYTQIVTNSTISSSNE